MQFSVAAFFALAGSALAQYDPTAGFNPLTNPTMNEVIPAGKTFSIKWTPAGQSGAVNLVLYGGSSAATLQEVSTIASGVDATLAKYDWAVDASLGTDKAYGIRIALASNTSIFQWSNPFTIEGSSSGSGSSSSASSTSTGTSSSKTGSPSSTSSVTTASAPTSTSSTKVVISTPIGNSTTTATTHAGAGATTLTTVAGASTTTSGTGSATSAVTVPVGGAMSLGASSFAAFCGVFVAVLAM